MAALIEQMSYFINEGHTQYLVDAVPGKIPFSFQESQADPSLREFNAAIKKRLQLKLPDRVHAFEDFFSIEKTGNFATALISQDQIALALSIHTLLQNRVAWALNFEAVILEVICAEMKTRIGIVMGFQVLAKDTPEFWASVVSNLKNTMAIHSFLTSFCLMLLQHKLSH